MSFSSDSRWLVTSSMDCLVKLWDIPSGKLIDCFKFSNAPTSVCFSPSSEYLVTTHVNELGIYLWSNKTLYTHVALKQPPDDYEPLDSIKMPSTNTHLSNDANAIVNENEEDDLNDYKNYTSPEQLAFELVTLSLLPESRWKNLVNLDIIRVKINIFFKQFNRLKFYNLILKNQQRNKPKEPPKAPKLAPFFLPTVSNEKGFTFKTAIEEHELSKNQVIRLILIFLFK